MLGKWKALSLKAENDKGVPENYAEGTQRVFVFTLFPPAKTQRTQKMLSKPS